MRRLITLLIASSTALSAQEVPRLTLGPANATLAAEFTYVTWARELKDRRVIITDRDDGRIVLADLTSGKVVQISRSGRGPSEYSRAQVVWSIAGDSGLMIDRMPRWLLFDGATIVATLGQSIPAVAVTRHTARGTDT